MSTGGADARAEILDRIRGAIGVSSEPAAADYQRIARDYGCSASLDAAGRRDLFEERLRHYQVGVHRCEAASIARTVADTLAARGRTGTVVPVDLPREWLPAGLAFIDDVGLGYAELDRSQGVLTGCSVAIAVTGTIVLRHGRAEGRRALTLVPDYHLCIVLEDQIVETVPEAFRLLAHAPPELVTTISGPSATADIEMTRIRGVHGPRTLDVIIGGR